MDNTELQAAALALHPELKLREKADRPAIQVPVADLIGVMNQLRQSPTLAFDMLCAHTAIDRPTENQIELVYQLYSTTNLHYLMVCVYLPRSAPIAPSVMKIWQLAEWQAREVYDMFGVGYTGHTDLRRVLLEDEWKGHPLLKDYKDDFMLERPW